MTRINWFSPLLPQRTEIAHLTCRIAQALMDRFDVIFWSNVEDASQFLPAGAKVERVIKSNQRGRKHLHSLLRGINIYHLGNDARYHTEIAEIHNQYLELLSSTIRAYITLSLNAPGGTPRRARPMYPPPRGFTDRWASTRLKRS